MAYTFSWIVSTPYVLSSWGILPSGNFEGGNGLAFLLFAVKAYAGPTLAAIIMTSVTEGREGLRRLRHRLTQWRTRWQWYLFILVGIPADLVRYDQPTRGACDLSRSHTRNSTELSSRFFCHLLSDWAAGRNRLAWLRCPECNHAMGLYGALCSLTSCGASGICCTS